MVYDWRCQNSEQNSHRFPQPGVTPSGKDQFPPQLVELSKLHWSDVLICFGVVIYSIRWMQLQSWFKLWMWWINLEYTTFKWWMYWWKFLVCCTGWSWLIVIARVGFCCCAGLASLESSLCWGCWSWRSRDDLSAKGSLQAAFQRMHCCIEILTYEGKSNCTTFITTY